MRAVLSRGRWLLVGLVVAAVSAGSVTTLVLVRDHHQPEPELLAWFDQTAAAVREQGAPDATASRTWALAWWAADRALTRGATTTVDPSQAARPVNPSQAADSGQAGAAPGETGAVGVGGRDDGDAFATAAVASAVHDVLVATVPGRREPLDTALRESMGHAGPGQRTSAGAAAGRAQAEQVLAERAGDGLTADALQGPFTPPPEAPGVWRPTPPGFSAAVEVRQGVARPFFLTSPGQLRPGPPPAVGSTADVRDLVELRDFGVAQGSRRSPDQTEVARFFQLSQVETFTRLVRPELVARNTSLRVGTHLLSVLHRAAADAEIAVFDAKYAYLHWRPVTALAEGVPGVAPVPGWTPLIDTPAHPEYPSAHTVYAGTVVTVLSTLLDGEPVGLTDVIGVPGKPRSFGTWAGLLRENEDARVYGGIHFRTSDEVGTQLGEAVGRQALASS